MFEDCPDQNPQIFIYELQKSLYFQMARSIIIDNATYKHIK